MTGLVAAGTVILLMAASIGAGAAILRLLGIAHQLAVPERIVWCFPIGLAALGWVLFYPAAFGWLSTAMLLAICIVAALGLGLLLMPGTPGTAVAATRDAVTWFLLAATAAVLGVDFLEALAPPADGDTLAYHFTLAKRHLAAGELVFIPRAIDGAPPQLIHMTYMAALGLGGERALTLWTMASGWMTAIILYVLARRWLSVNWSLAIALIYLSTPAVLQTGGTGHVEPRLAQFVLIGALACGIAMQRNAVRYAALAGICAGAFAAAKYTGLIFGAACLIVLLLREGRAGKVFAFAATGLLLTFQWYYWAWINTGDPLFPMLYGLLGTTDPGLWTDAQDALFRAWLSNVETPIPTAPWWFVLYPFYATFVYDPALENGRTGLGVFAFLVLPFAVGYVLRTWRRGDRGPLFFAAIILTVMFALWFFSGAPQRVRHLVPLYPLAILCLTVAAVYWATQTGVHTPLATGAALCIVLQLGGQIIFGLNYARHVFSGETRAAFLRRNVSMYAMVPWINAALDRSDRVLIFERQLLYLIDVPTVMSHPVLRKSLNFTTLRDRPEQLFDQLRAAEITHIMDVGKISDRPPAVSLPGREAVQRLLRAGCLVERHRERSASTRSRTLAPTAPTTQWMFLYALTPETCRL